MNNFNKGLIDMSSYSAIPNLLNKSTESHNQHGAGAQTPQYIITCEQFFSSDIEGYENNSAPCLWIEWGAKRSTTYDASGELSGDGRIVTSDPVICMKYGSWSPIIQQFLYQGNDIKLISIKRLSSIKDTKIVIQELNYRICSIKQYNQSGDTIVFSFNALELEDISKAYDHSTGELIGNVGSKFNTSTLKYSS